MDIITSLSRKELKQLMTETFQECLQDKISPPQPELSDRCNLADACEILALSKSSIYKLTHEGKVPFMHFGRFLTFSRRQLIAYRESHTVNLPTLEEVQEAKLVKAANKKLAADERSY